MSVTLTGLGGLYTRLGKIFHLLDSINLFVGEADLSGASIRSIGVGVTNIDGQYLSSRPDIANDLYPLRDSARTMGVSTEKRLSTIASNTVIQMVNDDLIASGVQGLVQPTLQLAMTELIRQMVASSDSVNAPAVPTATVTAGTNNGTASVVVSVLGPAGKLREYMIAETLQVVCSTDVPSGTATAGNETWTIQSPPSVDQTNAWNWPKGSGVNTSVTAIAPDGSSNLLVNGTFEAFTVANTPDFWPKTTGSFGTSIKSSTGSYQGTTCLQFVGDGAELTNVYQPFDDATNGTASILSVSTVYGFSCYVQFSAVPTLGVLEFALTTSGGTIIQDDQTVEQKITLRTVKIASTANVASLSGEQTIDGVLTSTSRILLKNQTTTHDNGIWVTAAGAWARAVDCNTAALLQSCGMFVAVQSGSTNASTMWKLTTPTTTFTLGTDPIAFSSTPGVAATTYNLVAGFFRTPTVLSSSTPLHLRIRLAVALDNTKTVNIDNVTLSLATQAYQGGPYVLVVPGSVRSVIGDKSTVAVANDWTGGFQKFFQRVFDMRSFGLQLPSNYAGTETISDSLIT